MRSRGSCLGWRKMGWEDGGCILLFMFGTPFIFHARVREDDCVQQQGACTEDLI